jgi:clan AA aspartic protease
LAWSFTDDALLIPIRLSNPLLDTEYPIDGQVMAALDTGYTGFVLIPPAIFRALKLDELRPIITKGQLADGRSIELRAAHGILGISELRFEDEGLIETNPEIREILFGMRAMRRLKTAIDGCRKLIMVDRCDGLLL